MKLDPQAPLPLSLRFYVLGLMLMGLGCKFGGSDFLMVNFVVVSCLYGFKLMFMGVGCRLGVQNCRVQGFNGTHPVKRPYEARSLGTPPSLFPFFFWLLSSLELSDTQSL